MFSTNTSYEKLGDGLLGDKSGTDETPRPQKWKKALLLFAEISSIFLIQFAFFYDTEPIDRFKYTPIVYTTGVYGMVRTMMFAAHPPSERIDEGVAPATWSENVALVSAFAYASIFGVYAVTVAFRYETVLTPKPSQSDLIAPHIHLPVVVTTLVFAFPLAARWFERRGCPDPTKEVMELYAMMWLIGALAYAMTVILLAWHDTLIEGALADIPITRGYGLLYRNDMVGYARKYWRVPGDVEYIFTEIKAELSFSDRSERLCNAVRRLAQLTLHSELIREELKPYIMLCSP